MAGILVYGEASQGRLASITAELLGAGRRLAQALGQEVGAIFLGQADFAGPVAQEAVAFGADKVYLGQAPWLWDYQAEAYASVMEKACRQLTPDILLLGQTSQGRDLAPRLAFRLETGLATDCIDLAIDPDTKLLVATRPVYGGNALADVACPYTRPQMATVRSKSQEALPRADPSARRGEVIPLEIEPVPIRARFVERVRQEATGVKLEDADVVVSGGRGLGSAEGFIGLEEMASLLGGAVGCTRAAVDNGWRPSTSQVGLTGKVVAPTLYVAVALSGSSQHLAGCSGSKNIVAINRDPEANIFKVAKFGVVGDYRQVFPAFLEKAKELRAG